MKPELAEAKHAARQMRADGLPEEEVTAYLAREFRAYFRKARERREKREEDAA